MFTVAPDYGTIVTTAVGDLSTQLIGAAPALLGIGVVAFAVPFVFRWAKRLIS